MNTPNGKKLRLDYYILPAACDGSGSRTVAFGFSRDGNMWMDPDELGLSMADLDRLERLGRNSLLPDHEKQTVLVNCHAFAELIPNPSARSIWLKFVDEMVQKHKKVRAEYDATRTV
jgi:hypothetical protein